MKLKTALIAAGLTMLFTLPAYAGWFQEGETWKYDSNGTTLTNQWIEGEVQGDWYYVGMDGVMLADTTQTIDGIDYTFDASGKWQEPSAAADTTLYTNEELGYSIALPNSLYPSNVYPTPSVKLAVENDYMSFVFANHKIPSNISPTEFADNYASMNRGMFIDLEFISKTDVELGGYTFQWYHNQNTARTICNDIYSRVYGDQLVIIKVNYSTDRQADAIAVLNSLKPLS